MTREEAIEVIRKEYACVDADCDIERNCGRCELHMPSKEPILKAYDMAIQALSQEPTDAISRDAVLDAIEREDKWLLAAKGHNGLTEIAFSGLKARVDASPSVTQKSDEQLYKNGFSDGYEQGHKDAEQKSGKWIKWWEVIKHEKSEEHISHWKCSVCDKEQDPHSAKFINFCPNCGAKMESEARNE